MSYFGSFLFFFNQTLFFIFLILCVDLVHENGGKKKSVMKNTKQKRYKILGKKEVKESQVLKPRHRHQKMRRNQPDITKAMNN